MHLGNIFKLSWRSLNRNKMRSALTMLGIVIGVAAVIAMLAVGQGARDSVQAQISSLGTNVLIVWPQAATSGGVRMEAGTTQRLSEDDAAAIKQYCPAVKYTSPIARTGAQVVANGQNWRSSIQGVYPSYLDIRDWPLASGMSFTESDDRGATKVCLLGKTVVDNIFGPGTDPVGQIVRIKNLPFKVVGVLQAKGQNAMGMDQDDIVLVPYSTAQKKLIGGTYAQTIFASAQTATEINEASAEITQFLRDRHKLNPWEDNDFVVRTQSDLGSAAESTASTMTMLLASIASISLIVGGIGIMNIMLVSVTERTREIGIRMAVGARGRDVLMQFLVEAVAVSVVGGALGVSLGVGASEVIAARLHWPIAVAPEAIGLAFSFSAAIGIFFGWYPARKAASLNPIDALRYE